MHELDYLQRDRDVHFAYPAPMKACYCCRMGREYASWPPPSNWMYDESIRGTELACSRLFILYEGQTTVMIAKTASWIVLATSSLAKFRGKYSMETFRPCQYIARASSHEHSESRVFGPSPRINSRIAYAKQNTSGADVRISRNCKVSDGIFASICQSKHMQLLCIHATNHANKPTSPSQAMAWHLV
jgi:hypothetical protein